MSGLQNKYKITKADGTPLSPRAKYFVLRYDEHQVNEAHKRASQEALKVYAVEIAEHNDELARDLFHALDEVGAEVDIEAAKMHVENMEQAAILDSLTMHQRKHLRDNVDVMRVPGGLIYSFWDEKGMQVTATTFVPEPPIEEVTAVNGYEIKLSEI